MDFVQIEGKEIPLLESTEDLIAFLRDTVRRISFRACDYSDTSNATK
jgi:hypothetical protein